MKIVVMEYKKLSPFESLYEPISIDAKTILREMGKEHFSTKDLYQLHKLGCKIKYTHK